MEVVHHQRFAGPGHVSVERLFSEVRRHLPPPWLPRVAVCPNLSRGVVPRLQNALAARRRAGSVNHVVGDVQYLTLALPHKGLVLTIHDCAALGRLTGLAREVLRRIWFVRPMARAQVVTTISEAMRNELVDLFGDLAAKVRVIPNCVRSEFVSLPKKFHPAAPIVLQVGTGWNKNVEGVAEALRGTPCRLEIVGELSIRARAQLTGMGITFRELGRISDAAVLAAYQRCDLVVFASLYEGFGLPILEAQATGRPVITSNYGAMAEAAGEGALLIDPKDSNTIREAIVRICQDSTLRAELVAKGFQNVNRFSPSRIANKYAEVYDLALHGVPLEP